MGFLARRIGVTHRSITQAIARADIVPLDNGLTDVAQADATYGRKRAASSGNLHQRTAAATDDPHGKVGTGAICSFPSASKSL